MNSVAKRLSTAAVMLALFTPAVGVHTAAAASAPEAVRTVPVTKAVNAPGTEWTFYAAFATAGACWAKAASYKNEYWWVDATTCVFNSAQNSWFMFYEA
ncbi:hypothetical protein GCM10010329_61600 [Streptomyces spiroverticillatus]|uniref:Lactococcin 972 family bacteriocin n=1 Tax=Streptomyces finlayi TaxID=67296 RepID=A0A919CF69_9ACTN|nr:hypothetical protein [Streptomyces finlayi]GHA30102.1 hypothetical protein GCM10010329_61600 [Streptomyces spiroverticillatus]GHD15103.1 hypothetical protein GCM10010334_74850 [Streptomyces finlayi]